MIRPAITLCLGLLLATIARADDVPFKPYPDASVTAEQITAYQSQVKSTFGDTEQERAAEQVVMYFDNAKLTQYIFTLPTNPAHPGCIIRRIVTRSNASFIEQAGYFAGSVQAFGAWFAAYQQQNEQARQPR